jgi:hypothetical protein
MERINVEITNRRNGGLEQGGVCGMIESYPAALVMEVMECDEDELEYVEALDIVPHTYVTLADYMRYHYPSHVRVVRRGQIIE